MLKLGERGGCSGGVGNVVEHAEGYGGLN